MLNPPPHKKMASPVAPYTVNVPEAKLESLRTKLEGAVIPEAVPCNDGWGYGVPSSDLKRLTEYWKNGFDWRKQEAKINELPNYMTTVSVDGFDDIDLHFVHRKSSYDGAIPLLFVHGWPGSFLEATKVLPLLTENRHGLAFDVVIPSLPNFAFSSGVGKVGFGVPQYAEALHKLMSRLGYSRYVTQGGDWGFCITQMMAIQYPQHVLACHFNNVMFAAPPKLKTHPLLYLKSRLPDNADHKQRKQRNQLSDAAGYGYSILQSTKPATIGFALADSPVGILSWIYEKLHDWSDGYAWTDDEILTWVSLYYLSVAGPAASVQVYYEVMHAPPEVKGKMFSTNKSTKFGWSIFPNDVYLISDYTAMTLGKFVTKKKHASGGHFAAWEKPELLVGDLRYMFGQYGGAADIARTLSKERREYVIRMSEEADAEKRISKAYEVEDLKE